MTADFSDEGEWETGKGAMNATPLPETKSIFVLSIMSGRMMGDVQLLETQPRI